MIGEILRVAHRADAWLRLRLGRPYHVILGIGLIIEVIRHVRELAEAGESASGILGASVLIVFYLVLLIHQLGELHGHAESRRLSGNRAATP